MMDVRLFRRRLFAVRCTGETWLNFLGMQSVRFLMPFYLQAVLGLHPTTVGLVIVPGALCMMIAGPMSGFLSDRIGWRWFTRMGGMGISCAGLLILSNLQPDSPVPLAIAGMVCQSMGVGILQRPQQLVRAQRGRAKQARGDIRLPEPGAKLRKPVQHRHSHRSW